MKLDPTLTEVPDTQALVADEMHRRYLSSVREITPDSNEFFERTGAFELFDQLVDETAEVYREHWSPLGRVRSAVPPIALGSLAGSAVGLVTGAVAGDPQEGMRQGAELGLYVSATLQGLGAVLSGIKSAALKVVPAGIRSVLNRTTKLRDFLVDYEEDLESGTRVAQQLMGHNPEVMSRWALLKMISDYNTLTHECMPTLEGVDLACRAFNHTVGGGGAGAITYMVGAGLLDAATSYDPGYAAAAATGVVAETAHSLFLAHERNKGLRELLPKMQEHVHNLNQRRVEYDDQVDRGFSPSKSLATHGREMLIGGLVRHWFGKDFDRLPVAYKNPGVLHALDPDAYQERLGLEVKSYQRA